MARQHADSNHGPPTVSRRAFFVLAAGTLAGACAPSGPPSPAPKESAPAPKPTTAAAPAQKAPAVKPGLKTIVIGAGREVTGVNKIGRTDPELTHMVAAGLVTRNSETLEMMPLIAEELPSIQKGTWKVNPDGTMVTTWRLKPDLKYHDGKPFSTKDFVFGLQVMLDPKVPVTNPDESWRLIERMETPDDRTLVIYWKKRYALANRLFANQMVSLPRHILEEPYKSGNYDAFKTHPFWNKGAVHLGAFKVVDYVPGSHFELAANEHYFLGRPKIDRVIWKIIPDSNAQLSAVLANQVDVLLQPGLTLEGGIVAEREWAARGQGTVKFTPVNWVWLNPSGTNPFFGWDAPNSAKVRQAMIHAINRQEMVDTLSQGKEQVLHVPIAPGRRQFKAAEAAAHKWAYDPQRARQLLAEAGWRPGADGILVNDRGERFSVEFRTVAGEKEREQMQQAIAGYLKAVGIETKIANLPDRQDTSEEYRNRWPGLYLGQHNIIVEEWYDRFHSTEKPTPENKWQANNVSLWANPAKDRVLDQLQDVLDDEQRRDQLIVEFARLFAEDLPHIPIKYRAETTVYSSKVKGVPVRIESGGVTYRTWNIHEWDKVE